jgi:hypothetical protein
MTKPAAPARSTIARALLTALAFLAGVAPAMRRTAQAQIVTYDSRSVFLAAVNSPTTVTFSGQRPWDVDVQYWDGGSTKVGGLTMSSPDGNLLMQGNPTGLWGIDRGTGSLEMLVTGNRTGELTFSFGALERAFALDFGSYTGQSDVFTYVLSNGQSGTFRNARTNELSFFGFTSDVPFTSVTLRVADVATAYDNITYGSSLVAPVTATPEPSTWMMLATGLVGLGVFARRRSAHRE